MPPKVAAGSRIRYVRIRDDAAVRGIAHWIKCRIDDSNVVVLHKGRPRVLYARFEIVDAFHVGHTRPASSIRKHSQLAHGFSLEGSGSLDGPRSAKGFPLG